MTDKERIAALEDECSLFREAFAEILPALTKHTGDCWGPPARELYRGDRGVPVHGDTLERRPHQAPEQREPVAV